MEILNVLVAAIAAVVAGAIWYSAFADRWIEASGVPIGDDGRPINAANPMIYVTALICTILVAGMMRHIFMLGGIDTLGKGLVAGLGIGLFLITPWMGIHYTFSARPMRLLALDGGYATLGCAIIGIVLVLF
jgi:hypothetical protein